MRAGFLSLCALLWAVPTWAVTITPSAATVAENATQQFTASIPSTWSTNCGSISSAGLYKAPLYPSTTCTVTANGSDGSTATAALTLVSPIVMTPVSASVPLGATQQFTASMPVSWTAKCGTISAGGVYTASGTVGSHCTIEGIATGAVKYTVYGYALITNAARAASTPPPFSLTPLSATVSEGGTQQFTASSSAAFSSSCGSITPTGLFTAPLVAASCTVTAVPASGSSAVTAVVSVTSPLVITPGSATTPQGSTQQFTANMPVAWASSCGTITAGGLFTPSTVTGAMCTVQAVATGAVAYTAVAYDTASAAPDTPNSVTPANPTLTENATQQFTASVPSTWSTNCGSISSTGLYKAPLYPSTSCTVTATATSGTQTASTAVNIVSPIVMTPVSGTVPEGGTLQFTASAPVTWSAKCGAINAAGLFTASSTPGSRCTIEGIATASPKYTVYGYATIGAPLPALTLAPASATLQAGATQQFTASSASAFATSCGSITAAGLYTAPLTPATCTITATATDGSNRTASSIATINVPLIVTPSQAATIAGQTQQFSANQPVSWTATCGTINAAGLFVAPATAGSVCTITAIATSGTASPASAIDNVTAAPAAFAISPAQASVVENATQAFTETAPATWTASCGTIDPNAGTFTAPLTPGTCIVTATATDGSGNTASAQVTVTSPLAIMPVTVNLHALNTVNFNASQPVTWTASCGTISPAGSFAAPASAGSCTITATASTGPAFTATAAVNVDVVNYTAWKGGGGNTGAQTDELALNTSNVSPSSFGINWTASVDGWVNAQPLYMNGVLVNGAPHNVVFVATANDSVYAFDGDTGAQLWQVSLVPPGATAVSALSVGFTSAPQIGILSTPVIDPTTNTLYVVAETSEMGATYFPHRLHALDIATGNEKFGGPVLVSNALMSPVHKLQRASLTLANGNVYIGFGSMQDEQPYHGLLFAFNAQTLEEETAWVVTPTGSEGGIWMGGAAPAVDEDGNIYVATGNGAFDGTTNFGESAVKLSPQLQVMDYFAPYNYAAYVANNIDLGSGDVMVVPDQTGAYPHELIVCGKPTPIYVLNRDNLGQLGTSSDNVVQRLDNVMGNAPTNSSTVEACFTAPAMWGQNVYFGGKYDVLKMFTLDPSSGLLSSTPVSQDSLVFGYPGADPVVSANGQANGIVWTIDTGTNTLRANDATNVANLLYSGSLSVSATRWTIPTVVNGHVYVAENGKVLAFGLTGTSQ